MIRHFPSFHNIKNNLLSLNNINNLSIITLYSNREEAILINQLEFNNIDYINGYNTDNNTFLKAYKPIYYYNALKNITTEYSLLCDSYDVIIDSFDEFNDTINFYDKDIIYSAWCVKFPNIFDIKFNLDQSEKLKYLCSGVVIGKTRKLEIFYKKISNFIIENYENDNHAGLKDYEQYWIYKFLYENHDEINSIGLDYKNKFIINM